MPVGELVTLPEPLTLTFRANVIGTNVAVVVSAVVILTAQLPVPAHPPPFQPPNRKPAPGAAVSVTDAPLV